MNIQQLEYIIAVDTHRHFGKAAAACFVTQPTLSAMIQKLEDELGVQIFDRSSQPVIPTECGREIIAQARRVIEETNTLRDIAAGATGRIQGEITIAVIPTVAIYLMPALAGIFSVYPDLKLNVRELTTGSIINKLRSGDIDAGIMATPTIATDLHEDTLFVEPLKVFVAVDNVKPRQYILPESIDPQKVWMLEEGHCLSKQFVNYCNLNGEHAGKLNSSFQTGSLETLLNMVEAHKGITIIPELAAQRLDDKRKEKVFDFKSPVPARQISLVTYRPQVKARLNNALKEYIIKQVTPLLKGSKKKIVEVLAVN